MNNGRRKRSKHGEKTLPHVPKEIVWDYAEAPRNLHWRLQRIADFFPRHGHNRETVRLLHAHQQTLRLTPETRWLVEIYFEEWNSRGTTNPFRTASKTSPT